MKREEGENEGKSDSHSLSEEPNEGGKKSQQLPREKSKASIQSREERSQKLEKHLQGIEGEVKKRDQKVKTSLQGLSFFSFAKPLIISLSHSPSNSFEENHFIWIIRIRTSILSTFPEHHTQYDVSAVVPRF
jgi:hypothetical protein